jgi:hypothetical protein
MLRVAFFICCVGLVCACAPSLQKRQEESTVVPLESQEVPAGFTRDKWRKIVENAQHI